MISRRLFTLGLAAVPASKVLPQAPAVTLPQIPATLLPTLSNPVIHPAAKFLKGMLNSPTDAGESFFRRKAMDGLKIFLSDLSPQEKLKFYRKYFFENSIQAEINPDYRRTLLKVIEEQKFEFEERDIFRLTRLFRQSLKDVGLILPPKICQCS
jgi:hypothetical protein